MGEGTNKLPHWTPKIKQEICRLGLNHAPYPLDWDGSFHNRPFMLIMNLDRRLIHRYFNSQGGTHILRHARMCRSNRSLFHKKSLHMGPIFYKISLNMGSFFQNFWTTTNCENGPIFKKKNIKMDTFFFTNDP